MVYPVRISETETIEVKLRNFEHFKMSWHSYYTDVIKNTLGFTY